MTDIFEYSDYRLFVIDALEARSKSGKGVRTRLAEALDCQLPFVSQVLNSEKDFNLEQIYKLSEHFELNEIERGYLIDLLSYCRAGTNELKDFFMKRLTRAKEEHDQRINGMKETQILCLEDQVRYYSHWHYAAIHMAVTIPQLQSQEALKRYFGMDEKELRSILEFLIDKGLIEEKQGVLQAGSKRMYVDGREPISFHHHSIWRNKILGDLKFYNPQDLHFTLCFSASKEDFQRLRSQLIQTIEEGTKMIRRSPEEKIAVVCVDLQGL